MSIAARLVNLGHSRVSKDLPVARLVRSACTTLTVVPLSVSAAPKAQQLGSNRAHLALTVYALLVGMIRLFQSRSTHMWGAIMTVVPVVTRVQLLIILPSGIYLLKEATRIL